MGISKILKKLGMVILMIMLGACQDVIDVEVQSGPERLVVEASIDWEKGTLGNMQTISLRTSSPYFDTSVGKAVTGASVIVTNTNNGNTFVFEDQNNGDYVTTGFVPIINDSYTLRIEYKGETYTASETMTSVARITDVYQSREDGIDEDELEVHVVFTDPIEEGNNYLFKFHRRGDLLPTFEDGEDEFVNGNEIDWWYEIEDDGEEDLEPFKPGDIVDIEMIGISRPYYDYIKILIDQMEGVDLFDATPVAVKGNCINETTPDNYAFGYFRLTEVNRISYTFVEE